MAAARHLQVIATMSVGYSHIDVPEAVKRGIRIGYTPGVLTDATADLVMALTLALARHVPAAAAAVRSGEWSSWKPYWLTGKSVGGQRVGIIGAGRIGSAVARRFKGFGCGIHYWGRSGPKPELDAELGASWLPLPDLLRECDIVVLLCALTAETRGLLTAERLALMKHGAMLVNAARGEVICQDELVAFLRDRPDVSAGLDVTTPEPLPTDHPLLALPNCLVLPHIGSATTACRNAMAELCVDNCLAGMGVGMEMRAVVGSTDSSSGGGGATGHMPAEVPETAAAAHAGSR